MVTYSPFHSSIERRIFFYCVVWFTIKIRFTKLSVDYSDKSQYIIEFLINLHGIEFSGIFKSPIFSAAHF